MTYQNEYRNYRFDRARPAEHREIIQTGLKQALFQNRL
jgi:hypothetical protein